MVNRFGDFELDRDAQAALHQCQQIRRTFQPPSGTDTTGAG